MKNEWIEPKIEMMEFCETAHGGTVENAVDYVYIDGRRLASFSKENS